MFKEIGQFASLMKNLPKIQSSMAEMQKKMGEMVAEASSGAGYVTVRVNGRGEVLSCKISDEAMTLNDREMLEDLIVAAVNQAMMKINAHRAEEMSKMAGDMGMPIPPGMIPGM